MDTTLEAVRKALSPHRLIANAATSTESKELKFCPLYLDFEIRTIIDGKMAVYKKVWAVDAVELYNSIELKTD